MLAVTRGGSSPDHVDVGQVADPRAGEGEVLVRMTAAALNPHDLAITTTHSLPQDLARIPGRDLVGIVEEGPAELLGMRVWATGGELGGARDGFHAEFVILPTAAVRPVPQRLSTAEAATVGVAFSTAWFGLVEYGAMQPGDHVLVTGASGAVGSAALQLGRWLEGSTVTAFVRDGNARQQLVDLGATQVVDQPAALADEVAVHTRQGATLALDTVGGPVLDAVIHAMAPRGRMVTIAAPADGRTDLDMRTFYRLELLLRGLVTLTKDVYAGAAVLEALSPAFEHGDLQPLPVVATYPLARAADAYKHLAKGPRGKIVLTAN